MDTQTTCTCGTSAALHPRMHASHCPRAASEAHQAVDALVARREVVA